MGHLIFSRVGPVSAIRAGTWTTRKTTGPNGKKRVIIGCPICGRRGNLDDHTIDENGIVFPSVVCPHLSCSFHDYVALRDWRLNRGSEKHEVVA